ncbi:MAG: hypothetical protein KBA62_02580 [Polaromonas sp.]|jgi:hypothetical protein|nr:hypothetical protein [Polaromonas sp.]MBP6156294.1 hypothetical protein [Polaromonas sp.]MBP7115176.1 hypothetical protein [Polaromonas sp.]MBP9830115.1 hypothetical protein [Polaromonas sp.]
MTPNLPNPAIVSQSVTRRLPRRYLLVLCLAYILPGYIGRDPWKNADISAYGFMLEIARGQTSWLSPAIFDQLPDVSGLLSYWLGAASIGLTSEWIPPDFAARIPFIAMLAITLLATWHGIYYLARSPSALPVVFAFGGEAKPKDYARTVADGGLLALIATLGLAQFSHETTPAMAQLCFTAITFYALAAMSYHSISSLALFFIGMLGLSLSGAPSLTLIFGVGGLLITYFDNRYNNSRGTSQTPRSQYLNYAVMFICILFVTAISSLLDLWRWSLTAPEMSLTFLQATTRLLLWFTWPTFPLVIWSIWRWRNQITRIHVALPIWFGSASILTMLLTRTSDRALLLALPAFATLAAFALPTLGRRLSALIDWFTLFFFTGLAGFLWVTWIAMQWGSTPAMVTKLVPGFVVSLSWLPFLFAMMGTLAWGWLVSWRIGKHRSAMWKSMVLPAGGATLCWLLLMTLWLPVLNFARSYSPLIDRVTEITGKANCVDTLGLSVAQITAFKHHGQLKVKSAKIVNRKQAQTNCPWLIVDADAEQAIGDLDTRSSWKYVTKVRRPSDDNEDVLLYKRVP